MIKQLSLLALLTFSLSGCLYKMDIHQGNVLDQEQIDKLRTGMNKNQVIALLGSPQLTDPFHSQRWDYYSMSNLKNQRRKTETVLTLKFEGSQLNEIIEAEPESAPE
jgi:outer membrane protein assembly factor BamE